MLAFTALGLFWTPYAPSAMNGAARNAPPSAAHPFGCDSLGRDVLSRTLEGAGSTLTIALAAGFTAEEYARVHAPIGLPIGAETPEEIAVSVTAQLIAVRAGLPGV